MMTTKEKSRRSREERRHGGCVKGRGQTPAQQERRSGRKGPQACKASSVRFPARRLAVERRDWLQRQDLNLRHRGYEPRGMTASLRCGKSYGAPSFCSLLNRSWCRAQHIAWPNGTIWPMIGKPLHRRIKSTNIDISASSQCCKLLAVAKDAIAHSFLFRLNGRTIQFRNAEQLRNV